MDQTIKSSALYLMAVIQNQCIRVLSMATTCEFLVVYEQNAKLMRISFRISFTGIRVLFVINATVFHINCLEIYNVFYNHYLRSLSV